MNRRNVFVSAALNQYRVASNDVRFWQPFFTNYPHLPWHAATGRLWVELNQMEEDMGEAMGSVR